MRVLVVIANYGTKNDRYLHRLLDEYRSMPYETHVVVLTNAPKHFGADVEVIIEVPVGDPWSFPFAHKNILASRVDDYDLFIYSEDDTLITQRNIELFLSATDVLPENEIAGFMRSETAPDGTVTISTMHGHFHWDPCSVVRRGQYMFAHFTNEHSGAYLLTRHQLERAIQSGGFLVGAHQGRYHLPETAATDPYTQCGFKKMICISRHDDVILPHLPNVYVGKLGLPKADFLEQIRALRLIQDGTRPCSILLDAESKAGAEKWSKSYYEPVSHEVLNLIPDGVRTLLSYGCGWGAMEEKLSQRGIRVTAVPLDSVIAACAEARGLEVICGSSESILKTLSGRQFDCVLLSDVLHLLSNPADTLSSLSSLLRTRGLVVASVPNTGQIFAVYRRLTGNASFSLGRRENSGRVHAATYRRLMKWLAASQLRTRTVLSLFPERIQQVGWISQNRLSGCLASRFVALAERL